MTIPYIGGYQENVKLVFVVPCPDYLSLRTSAHAGVAIPRLERICIDHCPTAKKNTALLVVIATWFHSSGGLPRQSADWLAMTACLYKHQSVVQMYFMCHPGKVPRLPGVTCFLENALNGQFPGFRQNGYKKTGALPRNCGKYSLTIVSK